MNILAIGNSFSQDATRYLHQIAAADGFDLNVVNLYIGGCPLRAHYLNMLDDKKAYGLEYNGANTGFAVSIKEALINRDWDYITIQQVSHESNQFSTYEPYLSELSAYIKKYSPHSKQIIHQTWAYQKDSDRLCNFMGYKAPQDMFTDVESAYEKAYSSINAQGMIKSGEAFQNLLKNGAESIHRDPIHASLGLGRYTLGLLWYGYFSKNDIENNTFSDFDEPISDEEIKIAKKSVKDVLTK